MIGVGTATVARRGWMPVGGHCENRMSRHARNSRYLSDISKITFLYDQRIWNFGSDHKRYGIPTRARAEPWEAVVYNTFQADFHITCMSLIIWHVASPGLDGFDGTHKDGCSFTCDRCLGVQIVRLWAKQSPMLRPKIRSVPMTYPLKLIQPYE